MRPIKLTMQAFGPYAETQILNMDDLGETGLYAITGETGAGKTTIFDAIVYALYGTGSGDDRSDGKKLRAVAAAPELETKVELEFASHGKIYKIVRKPAQMNAGKRTEGLVEKPASQVLTLPDGKLCKSNAEIRSLIEGEILGVTKEQFCQIVMIAQGEFRKLLRADTAERTKILREIFKTGRYDALATRMKKICDAQYGALCDSRRQVSFALGALTVGAESPLRPALENIKAVEAKALLLEDAEALARDIAESDEAEYAGVGAALRQAEQRRDAEKTALEAAVALQNKRDALQASREALNRQRQELDAAKRRQAEAEDRRPEIDRLAGEIATQINLLPKYDKLAEHERARRETEESLERARGDRTQAENDGTRLKGEQTKLTAEAEALGDAPQRLLAATGALSAAKEAGGRLRDLSDRVNAREAAEKALEQRREAMADAAESGRTAEARLEALARERDALGNTAQKSTLLEGEQARLADEAAGIDALEKLRGEHQEARASYARSLQAYHEKEAAARKARAEAEALRHRYNANIAGILAAELMEGQPCPVCGSVHHPRRAEIVGESATKEAVEVAEALRDGAVAAFNDQATACGQEKTRLDGLGDRLSEQLPGISEADWPAEIQRKKAANAEASRQNAEALRQAKADDARRQALESEEIPGAKYAAEAARERSAAAEKAVEVAANALDTAAQEVQRAAEAVGDILPADWTALDLSDALSENQSRQSAHARVIEQAQKDENRLEAIAGQQRQIEAALQSAAEARQSAANRVSSLSAQLEGQAQRLAELKGELPWPTEAECRASIRKLSGERESLEAAIEAARRAASDSSAAVAGTQGQIAALESDLKGAPEVDPEEARQRFENAEAALKAAQTREKDAHARRENNARHIKNLVQQAGEARKLDKEYRMMQDVCDTVQGRVSGGADQIPLETYVQTAYFERIIAYANQRLIHMSRNQYDLARQAASDTDGRKKAGLDLDVVDHANGQRRAVSTLSGGESFLAALSFALGMSDAIQASAASAVQLDTMFVDEGFGSLSDSFLGLVMDELNDTANSGHRLIGVISHVDEVKEGISRRIEVTKSASGVSKAEIK